MMWIIRHKATRAKRKSNSSSSISSRRRRRRRHIFNPIDEGGAWTRPGIGWEGQSEIVSKAPPAGPGLVHTVAAMSDVTPAHSCHSIVYRKGRCTGREGRKPGEWLV